MKILFNIILIIGLLTAFVPAFRKFLFYVLVGRHFVKEQKRATKPNTKEGEIRVETKQNNNDDSRFRGGEYVDYEEIK
jgi:hypothetical protein